MRQMIKKIAWEAFKNTGDINTFLELKQIENIEQNINIKEIEDIQKITNMNVSNQNMNVSNQNMNVSNQNIEK